MAGGVGRDTSKCTLLRDDRKSFAKWPGLPQLKQVREDGLPGGIATVECLSGCQRTWELTVSVREMGNEGGQ